MTTKEKLTKILESKATGIIFKELIQPFVGVRFIDKEGRQIILVGHQMYSANSIAYVTETLEYCTGSLEWFVKNFERTL